jgi:hypothetical protein
MNDSQTTSLRQHRPLLIFLAVMLASLAALPLLPAVPQSQAYHDFADQRTLLGIPNFWNVVSNLPFIVIGALGLRRHHGDAATVVLFGGIFLTGFGSAYYHWAPSDDTLFWDRLPMALGFSAILAGVVAERIDARAGALLLWPLLALGVASLIWWRVTGDLRLYGWVQFFPCLALPGLLLLLPAKYTGAYHWIIAALLYVAAKILEYTDRAVNDAVGGILSGHTLKHLFAAAACYAILRYFDTRKPVGPALTRP